MFNYVKQGCYYLVFIIICSVIILMEIGERFVSGFEIMPEIF